MKDAGDFIDNLTSAAGPVASQAVNAAKSITSEVPELVTKVQSAASAAATSLEGSIKEIIPRNLSLGTRQLCIGFFDSIDCKGLPLNLSDVLPDSVEDLPSPFKTIVQDSVDSLQPIATALTNITYIRVSLIVGLVLVCLFAILFIASTLGKILCIVGIVFELGLRSKIIVHTVLGLICCVPVAAATAILILFREKVNALPSWIQVEHGEVGSICIGALSFAAALTITTALSPLLLY